jgi:hypothetical protein
MRYLFLALLILLIVWGCETPKKEPTSNPKPKPDPLFEEPVAIANPTPIMFVTPPYQSAVVVDRMSSYAKEINYAASGESLPVIYEYKNWFELLPFDSQRQFIRKVFVMNELDVPLPDDWLSTPTNGEPYKYGNLEITVVSRSVFVEKRKSRKPGPYSMFLEEDVYSLGNPANLLIYKPGDSTRRGPYAWGTFKNWSPVCKHGNYSDCAGFWDNDTFYAPVHPARVEWARGAGDLREKFDSTYNFRYIKIKVKGPGIGECDVGPVMH